MQNKKIVITVVILIFIIAAFNIITIIKNNNFAINSSVRNKLVVNDIYEYELDKININTLSSDVNIKVSDDNNIKVKVYGDKKKTIVEQKNNELTIKTKSALCVGLCVNTQLSEVVLYLPESFKNVVNVDTTSGDVVIAEFPDAQFKITTQSGDLVLNTVKKVNIKTTSGDINIDKTNYANIKTTSGDTRINHVKNIKLESTSGDVKIKELNINNDSRIITKSGDVLIENINDIYIDTKTTSGSIKIKNNNKKADVTLTIKTTSGDIKVK